MKLSEAWQRQGKCSVKPNNRRPIYLFDICTIDWLHSLVNIVLRFSTIMQGYIINESLTTYIVVRSKIFFSCCLISDQVPYFVSDIDRINIGPTVFHYYMNLLLNLFARYHIITFL